ncbi:hypothetical protein BCR33DRAFT_724265 [Rhizoclosmatium globosum]|uniref:Uncharacterized protein n=1 Tax=Rhizoclosmatium globosum TaxID=329046 RepID=A0A1Y2B7C7_9FUNG|nr:hypothetical protein BCR33DRAFT_724265 [Rhizoclosmatium globosum]|eukprot:ORY30743.1 hypothetical protein BCR33DRAFT_724265 [Rhizoclosmatium globosum]
MAPRTALALVNSNTPRRQTQTQLQPSTKKNGTLTKKAPPTKTNDESHILVSAALFAKYKPFADPKTRSKSNVTVKKRKVVENEEEEVENVDGAVDDTPIVSRKKKLAVAKPQKQSTQESTTTKRVTRSRAKISGGLDVYRDSD